MSLYLDPTNKEIISIFSRLFPGKTTTDVMQSRVGMAAAQAVEASIRDAQPYYLAVGYDQGRVLSVKGLIRIRRE